MTISNSNQLVDRIRAALSDRESGFGKLIDLLRGLDLDGMLVNSLLRPDTEHPYGRRVLWEDDDVEVMLATWTDGRHCAPHDHGGSVGAVRVLQGEAVHRIWNVGPTGLNLRHEETASAGEVLICGRDLVHSMGDGEGERPLVTLHVYTGPIDHMAVYDTKEKSSLIVEGQCGAWVPRDDPTMIRSEVVGYHAPTDLS